MVDYWLEFCKRLQFEDASSIQDLIASGFSPNSSHSKSGSTALDTASKFGREDVVHVLLEAGAEPNVAIDFLERASGRVLKGRTALMHAANERVVSRLVSGGADPNMCDAAGISALRHFMLQRSRSLVNALLPHVSRTELVASREFLRGPHFAKIVQTSGDSDQFFAWVTERLNAELAERGA